MKGILFLLIFIVTLSSGYTQNVGYGIVPINMSIKKESAGIAQTIMDLNQRFPQAWIREYISVDLTVTQDGKMLKSRGENEALSEDQQQLLRHCKSGDLIKVSVHYYPDNNLPKEIKELAFTVTVVPDVPAAFPGGEVALRKYLQTNIMEPLAKLVDDNLHEVRIAFQISRDGSVSDVRMVKNSYSEEANSFLVSAMKKMPDWSPALNKEGSPAPDQYQF
ncbi:MAG: energy transducer TonB, partial [Saprospiraceae bacterium]|nr:energy transducer TonB [Saprospiraceae bacterium]